MKISPIKHLRIGLLSVAAVGFTFPFSAEGADKPAAANGKPATNSVPFSQFVIPAHQGQGRDPFFPKSTRLTVVTNVAPIVQPSPARLVLQGISGTTEHRFAIINGQTVTVGETGDVTVNGTRLQFRCLDIRDVSCVLEIGTERREIFLRAR